MGEVVGVDDLQTRSKWQVFEDFAEAPAGNLGDAVDIARDPAGAV